MIKVSTKRALNLAHGYIHVDATGVSISRNGKYREKAFLPRSAVKQMLLFDELKGLLALVGLGWWSQEFFREQYHWRMTMGPSVLSVEQEREKTTKPGSDFKECATDHGGGAGRQVYDGFARG